MKKFSTFLFLCLVVLAGRLSAANYDVALRAYTTEPQKGLVFVSTLGTANPDDYAFRSETSVLVSTGSRGATRSFWVWSIPARGYKFNSWTLGSAKQVTNPYTGTADQLTVTASTSATNVFVTNGTALAGWTKVPAHQVTFKQAFGGSYKVTYAYRDVVKNRYGAYGLENVSDEHSISAEQVYDTYASDEITLDAMGLQGNGFTGWYKDGVLLSTNPQYTCTIREACTIECRTSAAAQVRAKNAGTVKVTAFPQTIAFRWDVQGVENFSPSEGTASYDSATGVVTVAKKVTAAGTYTVTLNSVACTIVVAQEAHAKNITKNTTGSLSSLISAAASGDRIQLLEDVELSAQLTISKNLTLDLNGHVLSGKVGNLINITAGNVTIEGTTPGSAIRSEVENQNACAVYASGASLTIHGGLYVATAAQESATAAQNSAVEAIYINAGTATIENATIQAEALNKTYGQNVYGVYVKSTAAVSIADNTITSMARSGARGVYAADNSHLTTSGNTITATSSVGGTAYGIYAKGELHANDNIFANAVGTTCYAIYADVASSGAVTGGRFMVRCNATSGFGPINDLSKSASTLRISGGYYNINTFLLPAMVADHFVYDVPTTDPAYAEGYRYEISTQAEKTDIYVCSVYDASGRKIISYKDLPSAFNMAINNPGRQLCIVMDAPYTLPAGNYTLPANASLLIPHKAGQVRPYGEHPNRITERSTLALYRELVFAPGVNIVIKGTLEISAQQFIQSAQKEGIGNVAGNYGQLRVSDGCNVWLDNGAKLCAWGYMLGNGQVQAKSGSRVYEMFQVYDWKGGTNLTEQFLDGHHGVFPINQYFIQNIEMPVTYRPGAQLLTSFGIVGGGVPYSVDNIGIIGPVRTDENKSTYVPSMFEMDEANADDKVWVRKSYDPVRDRQVYEVNHSASINAISMEIMGFTFTSSDYQLPITNNMHFHLLSGNLQVTSDLEMLPGSEIEMDKESTVTIEAGKKVYLYDADQWDKYAFNQSNYAATVYYSPSWTGGVCPRANAVKTAAGLGDATINIHGTLALDGDSQSGLYAHIYTTTDGNTSDEKGGANIFSKNADAGTVEFYHAADLTTSKAWQWKNVEQGNASRNFIPATAPHAWLKNSDGSFVKTGETTQECSYCFIDGRWTAFETVGCFVKDNYNKWYIKPAEYVEVLTTGEGDAAEPLINANHLYTDKATGTRLFLQEGFDCQWWEVTPVSETNFYYCAKNARYYAYDATLNEGEGGWVEAKVTVTFDPANDDQPKQTYSVRYGDVPEFFGDDPVKVQDATGSYTFKGWKSETDPTIYKFNAMPAVTDDITYTAQYETIPRKYLITLVNALNGETVNAEYAYGTMPDYQAAKAEDAYFGRYDFAGWTPVLQLVTKEATYTASFTGAEPKSYNVRWVQEDGSTVIATAQSSGGVVVWPAAAADYALPEDDHYTYEAKWFSSVTGETYLREDLPLVGEDVDYVAVFEGTPKKFTVTFKNYDGTVLATMPNMPYGSVITYRGVQPTKAGEDFDGWDPAFLSGVTTVPGNVTYTAQFSYVPSEYKYVASIIESNGTVHNYKTISSAIADINNWPNATFRLLSNVSYGSAITLNQPITIDLNGYTLTSNIANNVTLFTVKANLTLMDGSGTDRGTIQTTITNSYDRRYAVFSIESDDVNVKMLNGNIRSGGHTPFSIYSTSTRRNVNLTINDGYIEVSAPGKDISLLYLYKVVSGSFTYNGGMVELRGEHPHAIRNEMAAGNCVFDYNLNGGVINIHGAYFVHAFHLKNNSNVMGEFNLRGTTFLLEQSGYSSGFSKPDAIFIAKDMNSNPVMLQKIRITGGAITIRCAADEEAMANLCNVSFGDAVDGMITGGRFLVNGATSALTNLFATTHPNFKVCGGFWGSTVCDILTKFPSGIVPAEYSIVSTGVSSAEYAAGYRYKVVPQLYKASVTIGGTTTPYESLGEAIATANATNGATVTLMADNEVDAPVSVTSNAILNLNGYTISGATALLSMNAESKTLRIIDNSEFANGKLTVSATNASARAIIVSAGTVVVEQGMYKVDGGTSTNNIFAIVGAEEGEAQKAFAEVTGGYFNRSVADQVADGYAEYSSTEPGYPYTVDLAQTNVASVTTSMGTQSFSTWEAAIGHANANSGAIVTLLQDVMATSTAVITRAMTVDLNGHTLSSSKTLFAVNAYGKTLTIRDSQNMGLVRVNSASDAYAFTVGLGNLIIENGRYLTEGNVRIIQTTGSAATATIRAGYFSDNYAVDFVESPKGLRLLSDVEKADLPAGLLYVVDTEDLLKNVIFKNYDGIVLCQQFNLGGTLDLSQIPVPTKPSDNMGVYTFSTWENNGNHYAATAQVTLTEPLKEEIFVAEYSTQEVIVTVTANSKTTYHITWADAVSAANEQLKSYETTINLKADIENATPATLTGSKDLRLNLNGFTLSGSGTLLTLAGSGTKYISAGKIISRGTGNVTAVALSAGTISPASNSAIFEAESTNGGTAYAFYNKCSSTVSAISAGSFKAISTGIAYAYYATKRQGITGGKYWVESSHTSSTCVKFDNADSQLLGGFFNTDKNLRPDLGCEIIDSPTGPIRSEGYLYTLGKIPAVNVTGTLNLNGTKATLSSVLGSPSYTDGSVTTLLRDVNYREDFTTSTSSILYQYASTKVDLAGHTFSAKTASRNFYFNSSNLRLTVDDSSVGKTGKVTGGSTSMFYITKSGTLTILNGTFENTRSSSKDIIHVFENGEGINTIVIVGGNFKGRVLYLECKNAQNISVRGGYFTTKDIKTQVPSYSTIKTVSIEDFIPAGYELITLPETDPMYAEGYRYKVASRTQYLVEFTDNSGTNPTNLLGDETYTLSGSSTGRTLKLQDCGLKNGDVVSYGMYDYGTTVKPTCEADKKLSYAVVLEVAKLDGSVIQPRVQLDNGSEKALEKSNVTITADSYPAVKLWLWVNEEDPGTITFSDYHFRAYTYKQNAASTVAWPNWRVVSAGETMAAYTMPEPKPRAGYKFLGWFDAPEGGNEFNPNIPITQDTKVYAHWEKSAEAKVTVNGIETIYNHLEDAVAAANAATNPTLTLLKDIQLTATPLLKRAMTFDLNGYTISGSSMAFEPWGAGNGTTKALLGVSFWSGGEVIITDSSVGQKGKIEMTDNTSANNVCALYIGGGTVRMTGGTISAINGSTTRNTNYYTYGVNAGSGLFIIDGGQVKSWTKDNYAVSLVGNVTVNGGKLYAESELFASRCINLILNTTTATVTGGELEAVAPKSSAIGIYVWSGNAVVSGGKFLMTCSWGSGVNADQNQVDAKLASATVTGGYYSRKDNIDKYCTSEYAVMRTKDVALKATYPYEVTYPDVKVAKDDVIIYKGDWADAISAANNTTGATVTLLHDMETTSQNISRSMFIDLNGYTLSGSGRLITVVSGAHLQLMDSRTGGAIRSALTGEYSAVVTVATGQLTVSDITIESTQESCEQCYAVQIYSGQSMVLNSGTIISYGLQPTLLNNGGTLTINGGTLTNNNRASAVSNYKPDAQFLTTINGGYFRSVNGGADIGRSHGTLVVNGGYYVHSVNAEFIAPGYRVRNLVATEPEYELGYRYKVIPKAEYLVEFTDNTGTNPTNMFDGSGIDITQGSFRAKTNAENRIALSGSTTSSLNPIKLTDCGLKTGDVVTFGVYDLATSVKPTSAGEFWYSTVMDLTNSGGGTPPPSERKNVDATLSPVELSNLVVPTDLYPSIKLWFWVDPRGNGPVTFSDYQFRAYIYKQNSASTVAWPNWRVVSQGDVVTTIPAAKGRPGYTFLGWFDAPEGGNEFDPSAPITQDTKVYAHWKVDQQAVVEKGGSEIYRGIWSEAISIANNNAGATITLLKDVSNLGYQWISTELTLDLNGHVLSGSNTMFEIGGGHFTIMDSQTGGRIESEAESQYTRAINAHSGKLTLQSGTVKVVDSNSNCSGNFYAIGCNPAGEFVMNGGTVLSSAKQPAVLNNGGTMTINGGVVTNNGTGGALSNYTDPVSEFLTTINGGYFSSLGGADVGRSSGTLVVKGGYYVHNISDECMATGYTTSEIKNGEPHYAEGYRYKVTSKTQYLVEFTDNTGTNPTNMFDGNGINVAIGSSLHAQTNAENRIALSGSSESGGGIKLTNCGLKEGDVVTYGVYDFASSVKPTSGGAFWYSTVMDLTNSGGGTPPPSERKNVDATLSSVELSNVVVPSDAYSYIRLWVWIDPRGNGPITYSDYQFRAYIYKQNAASTITWPNWRVVSQDDVVTVPAVKERPGYTFLGWYDAPEGGNKFDPTDPITHDMKVYAQWKALTYTVNLDLQDGENGSVMVSATMGENMPTAAMPTRTGYAFEGYYTGENGTGTQYYSADGTSAHVWDIAQTTTLYAKWTSTTVVLTDMVITDTEVVDMETIATTVTIKTTGSLEVTEDATLTTTDLIIEANAETSGELIGAEYVTATNAYFDYYFQATGYTKAQANWYAFSVPFEVDAQTGISYNGQHLDYVNDINIVRYNGATRAALGKDKTAIEYIDELPDHTLYPGVLYMAAFVRNYNEHPVRFVKKNDKPLVYSTPVQIELHASANKADANWNGIANPALYKAYLGAGVETGQYYVSGENRYITADLAEDLFPVGKPVYVQAAAEQSLVVNRTVPAAAPMRVMRADETLRFDVRIADGTGKMTDRLFARASEEAENTAYTIGADVAKAGVSNRVAQMWLSAYGLQLCQETALMDANGAEWNLGISVPTAGDYTISLASEETEDVLYLTYLGQPVWNLTDGAYVVSLSAGTTNDYGLRVVRARVPGAATSVENVEADGTEVKKWLIDGKLYIVVGEKVYNATGKLVK